MYCCFSCPAACLPGYGGFRCQKCSTGQFSPGGAGSAAVCKPCPTDGSGPKDQCGASISPSPSPNPQSPSPSPGATTSADLFILTTGSVCRDAVFDALEGALTKAILAQIPAGQQQLLKVQKRTCTPVSGQNACGTWWRLMSSYVSLLVFGSTLVPTTRLVTGCAGMGAWGRAAFKVSVWHACEN